MQPNKPNEAVRLGWDVGINVAANFLANLITVAGVYLLGVSAGLLPYSFQLLYIAILVLLGAGLLFCGACIFLSRRVTQLIRVRILLTAIYTVAVAAPLLVVLVTLAQARPPRGVFSEQPLERQQVIHLFVAVLVLGFGIAVSMLPNIWRYYDQEARRQRHAHRALSNRLLGSRSPRIIRQQRLPQRPPGLERS